MSQKDPISVEVLDCPLAQKKSLALVHLLDCNKSLDIVLEDPLDEIRPRWLIAFGEAHAYRSTLEELSLSLHLSREDGAPLSRILFANCSPWLQLLKKEEDLFDAYFSESKHYFLITEDEVIEVLSTEPPQISYLGPAPDEAPPAGKSIVKYVE